MINYQQFFSHKKITLMGLGLLGRGVGDAQFLAKYCGELIVTDLKTEKELKSSVAKLKKYKNIKFTLGGHRLEDFRNRDLIIKAAGVPLSSQFIDEAEKNQIPVLMSTALFAKFASEAGAKIIGITGTRGKSTTTQLIYEILQSARWRDGKKVWLGGNVRGVSTLALLPKIKSGDLVVLELDSWQLQGFGTLQISPQIAVFTNFMPDHLNYYHGDMQKYFADKANIFKYQNKGDKLFWGGEVPALPKSWKIKLPGQHNRKNMALAVAVARELGVLEKIIKLTAENFAGVPGRLELVKIWRGIKIYNDTTSTTPAATLAALEALAGKKKLVLIMGGADKTLDMSELLAKLGKYCKEVILLPGTGTDKIKSLVPDARLTKDLPEALKLGLNSCRRGDTLLFSPAFASFGLFKNEFDRGEQFNKLVKKLK